ncbi:hypothetical protein [Paraburkholderia hospita]|uniref:hypothetical protein n=1 Tax=Paraburkholderia hospita TaxID=169430 RepID=UPI003ECEBB47
MTPPEIDLTQPDAVRRELLDDDHAVKHEFARHLNVELNELAEVLAAGFRLLPAINEAANRLQTQRSALVAGFAFGVLDDLVISTKLMLSGKAPAAGNVMRQAVEGIAMSMLCSTDELLVIEMKKNQTPVRARYWEKVWSGDSRTQGHLAVTQLDWNAAALKLKGDGVARLRHARKHYNTFSHCGTLTIASRVALDVPGMVYVGGHFDPAKLDAYRVEMNERIGLCRVLPPFMDRLLATMPRPAGRPAAAAQPAEPA